MFIREYKLFTAMRREVAMRIAKWGTAATLSVGGFAYNAHALDKVSDIEVAARDTVSMQILESRPEASQELIVFEREIGKYEREIAEIKKEASTTNFPNSENSAILNSVLREDTEQRISEVQDEIANIQKSSDYQTAIAPQTEYDEQVTENANVRQLEEMNIKQELGYSKWRKRQLHSLIAFLTGLGTVALIGFNESKNRPSWPLDERKTPTREFQKL